MEEKSLWNVHTEKNKTNKYVSKQINKASDP